MANELKEINDIVKKCKILLLDIEGTTTSISFVKDKLFPYAEENVKKFLESQWENEDVKEAVTALRKLALEDKEKSVDGVVPIPGEDATKEEQIEGLVNNVKWQMSADRKAGPLKQLQGLIWKQGYDSGDIKGHVYEDVSAALEQWQSVDGQKVYIYSSGSVQAQKLLFGQSLAGDLLRFIEGHFDTAVGAKQEAASYNAIVEKIGCKADEILFLTDIVKEAEAARAAGLHAALVSREGNAPLSAEASASFAVLHSLGQLASNKRKTQTQDELPAKIAKTEIESEAKVESPPVEEAKEAKVEEKAAEEKPEKMEGVEESSTPVEGAKEQKEAEKPAVAETVAEEITETKEPTDATVAAMHPVVTEEKEKAEDKPVEQMETDSVENELSESKEKEETVVESVENVTKDSASVAEETPPSVVIEEVTNDKALDEAAEIINDIEPVVEEPPAEDMEVLQSVGEVLEKECDEILSKVQDVTNLDTIPVKPLLNTITEETMETENTDSNDIVDRILDTELELEMKQKEKADEAVKDEAKKETTEIDKEDEKKESESHPEPEPPKKTEDAKVETNEKATETDAAESSKPSPKEDIITEETKQNDVEKAEAEKPVEQKPTEESPESDSKVPIEPKDNADNAEVKPEPEVVTESQVNGKTNGESKSVSLNGDASKEDELSSRLSAENGKKEVNGSNGDSADAEKAQEEKKAETEVADIKVKSVPADEPRTDPIEQPTKA